MIAAVEWNELGTIHEDYVMVNEGTSQPQSPPASAIEVPATNTTER